MQKLAAQFLTPPTIAKRLGVKPEKVVGWIRAGRLRAIDVSDGRRPRFRVDPADFDDFLESRRVQPPTKRGRRPRRDATAYTRIYPEA